MPPPSSRYKWNIRAGRYTLGGRFVKQSEIINALHAALAGTRADAAALAAAYRAGTIQLMEWERLMRAAVKDAHLYSAALAKGGWAQMTQADFGSVGRILRDQYVYLNRFAAELESGLTLDGRFTARVNMYTKAARTTYYTTYSDVMSQAGMTECRNIRHSSDSCLGCIEITDLGWMPIEEMIPPGNRTCLKNCLCDIEFR